MFRPGKVLKVKVELSPDVVGFGRATIVEAEGSRLFLHLRTSKGEKRTLPKGTKVWFVSDSPDNPFNGLWSTTIVSSRHIHGKTALECTRPKFEAQVQRRRTRRVALNSPVTVHGKDYDRLKAASRNISRSGIGIEIYDDCADMFGPGHYIDLTIDSHVGPLHVKGAVVMARFNWLANKTDIGLEFVEMTEESTAQLHKILASAAGEMRTAPAGKDAGAPAGQLSHWLKTSKDNVNFIKIVDGQVGTMISEEDLDELEDDEGDSDE